MLRVKMKIVHTLPEEKWRHFVEEHPAGNIFHTPEMFQVFSRVKDFEPELWTVVDQEESILALMTPVHVRLFNLLFLSCLTTRSIVYGGVLCAPGEVGLDALELLLRTYKQKIGYRSMFTEIRNVFPIGEMEPVLNRQGFLYQAHLNYLINLGCPPEAIFQNIGSRTRKHIRHSLNQGKVVIEEVTNEEQLSSCYRLLAQAYSRAKVPLADPALFEAAFDLLYPIGMIRITLAKVGQAPAAVSMDLLYKDIIYGWYGGIDRSLCAYAPNEVLMWHILKWGAENGFCLYDFGGAGKPGEEYGVRDFKAKFGGNLVCYGRNIWAQNPFFLHLSKRGYEIFRRFGYKPYIFSN